MKLNQKQFDELKSYLVYDRKFRDNKKNIQTIQSRFKILTIYFNDLDFNRKNFTEFVKTMKEKEYTTAYINQFIKLAKHIDKYYKINELQDYSLFPNEEKDVDVLSPDDVDRLAEVYIDYAREADLKNMKYKTIIYSLKFTGARISEILAVKWTDLRDEPIPHLILNQTKIREKRYSPIPRSLLDLYFSLPHTSEYVFPSTGGGLLDISTINSDLKRRASAVGIKKRVYNHLFRHTFINFMLRNGAKLEQVSRFVGHKSIETTNRHYVHIMVEELSDILHAHHPSLKKHQTMGIVANRVKDVVNSIVDLDRFEIKFVNENKRFKLEIVEIK